MKATAVWESEAPEQVGAHSNENEESPSTRHRLTILKELAFRLLREVQGIGEVHSVNLESGLDFYDEVTRFEIDLIRRALLQTAGHQVRAARLLNLKVTTLNSKIKHYNIRLEGFGNLYPIIDSNEMETHQHA
jgi:transcriptional regulator with GAF, ATPase, and Fis domain